MSALVQKELRLVTHPVTYVMVALGALVLIPSWMYGAIFIYGVLVAFFNGLNAREMKDCNYSFSLPVSRNGMVKARICVMLLVEVAMLVVMTAFIALREPLGINAVVAGQDPVGTGANLFLIGFGFALFGLFNVVFYPRYFRNPERVGIPFLIACIPSSVLLVLMEALPYLPVAGLAQLGVPGFAALHMQLAILGAGVVVFALLSLLAIKLAQRAFASFDA